MPYDLFVLPCTLSGTYPAAVGGICRSGGAPLCRERLAEMARLPFRPPAGDGLLLDAMLAHLVRQCAPPELLYAAATVSVPGMDAPCGGVAGPVAAAPVSAPGTLRQLGEDVYGFAFPGSCACLMAADRAVGTDMYLAASAALRDGPDRAALTRYLDLLAGQHGQFLFVSDGSAGPAGCLCAIDQGQSELLWL